MVLEVSVVGKDAAALDDDDKLWCSGAWPYHLLQRIPHLLKNRSWCVTGALNNYASGAAPYGPPCHKNFCQTHQVIKSERAHSSSLWDGNNTFGIEPKQEKRAQVNNIHKQVTQTPCHSWWLSPRHLPPSSYPWPCGSFVQSAERGEKRSSLVYRCQLVYGCQWVGGGITATFKGGQTTITTTKPEEVKMPGESLLFLTYSHPTARLCGEQRQMNKTAWKGDEGS